MSSTTLFRASRPLFRQAFGGAAPARQAFGGAAPARQAFGGAAPARQAFRQNFRQGSGRRWQSTDGAQQQQSWFNRMWESEVGFKTVHFWAPVMKWALVLAGISDFARPAEKLSFTQNLALTCTGIIWTRWCLIIKPKNYLLAAVNFFLGMVGLVQITRIAKYESDKKAGLKGAIEDIKADAKETVKEIKG